MSSRPGGRGRRTRGVTALLVVLVGILVGCTSQPDRPATTPLTTAVGADATRSRAAELQAGLTHLLVERVHVTAAARAAVPDAARAAASASLDDASTAPADLLGGDLRGRAGAAPAGAADLRPARAAARGRRAGG